MERRSGFLLTNKQCLIYSTCMDQINKLNEVLTAFNINATCQKSSRNRHLAMYDVHLAPGCRVSQIKRCAGEIALALKSKSIPLVFPVTEEGIVRITVADRDAEVIPFRGLAEKASRPAGVLPLLLGETDSGIKLWTRMEKNPHILVAGETGSGKTTLLHTMIANVLDREDVWLYLMDPKQGLEFGNYEMKAYSIAYDYDSSLRLLDDVRFNMDQRNCFLNSVGIRSIEEDPAILPKILVVIDEIASLMLWDSDKRNPKKGQFEKKLVEIAQKSRSSGIYMVLATQRPSVNVITGLIKANFPARIACRVSSSFDSKVILDRVGAENLYPRRDAIISSPEFDFTRFQVAFTTPEETLHVSTTHI